MKQRSDATLKTLPPERQAELYRYMQSHSLRDCRAWLRASSVDTSDAALSRFYAWYQMSATFRHNEATTNKVVAALKAEIPGLSDERLASFAQRAFTLLCIRDQDMKGFVRLQRMESERLRQR
jgi:hypothetical protein